MTHRSALVLLLVLASTASSRAGEAGPASGSKPQENLQGLLSHGDSGDVLEDFFGGRVERKPPESAAGSRKYDPSIRWDDRPVRR